MQYLVSKRHTSGSLAGIVTTEVTSVDFIVGEVVEPHAYGGGYVVVAVEAAPQCARRRTAHKAHEGCVGVSAQAAAWERIRAR